VICSLLQYNYPSAIALRTSLSYLTASVIYNYTFQLNPANITLTSDYSHPHIIHICLSLISPILDLVSHSPLLLSYKALDNTNTQLIHQYLDDTTSFCISSSLLVRCYDHLSVTHLSSYYAQPTSENANESLPLNPSPNTIIPLKPFSRHLSA